MSRMTAFQFTLQPTAEQETLFKVAGGAADLQRSAGAGVDVSGDRTAPRAVITSVTVKQYRGRWIASFRITADDFHPDRRHAVRAEGDVSGSVGVDLGLIGLVVAATDDGQEVVRVEASKTFQRRQERIDRDLNSAINLARLVAVLLERPGRGSSPGSGPVSGRPGDQCATQAPKRHRQSKIAAAAEGLTTARTDRVA